MEKIFGGVDYVEAGECEGIPEKREARALVAETDHEKAPISHVENTSTNLERPMT